MSMLKNANDYHEEVVRKPTDEYLKINTKERVKAILSLGRANGDFNPSQMHVLEYLRQTILEEGEEIEEPIS